MLTPAFELSQNDTTITLLIKAPFAKISDTEIFIDGCEFKFYSKPYYLRLNLPGEIVENGSESAKYDTDKGHFKITVPKMTPGEHFDGLDMLTRLLAPAGKDSAKRPLIEVLDSTETCTDKGHEGTDDEVEAVAEEEIDWHIEQEPYKEVVSLSDPMYGFASQRSGVFKRLQSELHGIIDLDEADSVRRGMRRQLRIEHEDCHFEDEHYLADLYEDEAITQVLTYQPHWVDSSHQVQEGASPEQAVQIPEDLRDKMLKLPRKEYLLDKAAQKEAFLGLVDLMFAYAYNNRTTEGENNVESGWVIAKLSTMLSWLEAPVSVKAAVVSSTRRCLCYPLYRSWKLVKQLLRDVQQIFCLGRRCILRCLLEIHALLIDTDSRYILNDLYITDYCIWIQTISEKHIKTLANRLSEVALEKRDVGFELELLEKAAALAVEENSAQSCDLTSEMNKLSLTASHESCQSETHAMEMQPKNSKLRTRSESSSGSTASSEETETMTSDNSSSDEEAR